MSLKIIIALLALSGLFGIAFGYFLRWHVAHGKRGSKELEIKQMKLEAREDAKRITAEAEKKGGELAQEQLKELKEKESQLKKTEDRLIKREEFLDKRQLDIDAEVEKIKNKIEEVRTIKEKTEVLKGKKIKEIEKISQLTKNEAKQELLSMVEKQ